MTTRIAFALLAAALLSACGRAGNPAGPDTSARQSGFMGSGHVAAP